MIRNYAGLLVGDSLEDTAADVLRLEMPADSVNELEMQEQGFFLADRILKVSVTLSKVKQDLSNFTRRCTLEDKVGFDREKVLNLAVKAFPYDRRFNVYPKCSPKIASLLLKSKIDELQEITLAKLHEEVIGFIALKPLDKSSFLVDLAAVDERYRLVGAGMAIYAHAIKKLRSLNVKRMEGCISTRNTAVINVYAFFGGSFSSPFDVFLKEMKHDS